MARFKRAFPGTPRLKPPTSAVSPIVTPVVVPAVRCRPATAQRQPRQRLLTGMLRGLGLSGIPPMRFTACAPAKVQRKPQQRVQAGMLPGKGLSGIPPQQTRPRLVRLPPRNRGNITGPLAPGAVAVVTPIRPVVLAAPRRGPPARQSRILVGMLPGKGLSGIPEQFTKSRPAGVQRQPRQQLRSGMLPGLGLSGIPPIPVLRDRQSPLVPIRLRNQLIPGQRSSLIVPVPVSVVLRHRQRIRAVPSRLIPSPFAPASAVYQPVSAPTIFTRPKYRLVRQPPQRIATGMLPGKGLSGLPPTTLTKARNAPLVPAKLGRLIRGERGSLTTPVPESIILRNRQRIRPVASKLYPPPFVPAGTVFQAVSAPTIFARTRYRLARQPPQRILIGYLPGQGLSGIPPLPVLRHRQPKIRLVQLRLIRGERGSLTAPVPVPVVLRNRQRIRLVQSRLIPPFKPAAIIYPVVMQQARLIRPVWRLVRQPRQVLRTGMLSVASGIVLPTITAQRMSGSVLNRSDSRGLGGSVTNQGSSRPSL